MSLNFIYPGHETIYLFILLFKFRVQGKIRVILSKNNKINVELYTYDNNSIQNLRNIFLYMDTFQFINFATRSWILLKTYKAILHFWYLLITMRSCFMLISVNRLCVFIISRTRDMIMCRKQCTNHGIKQWHG